MWAGGEGAAAAVAPALGSTYAPTVVGPREGVAVPLLTDTFRLEFVTPSWFEVDAVRDPSLQVNSRTHVLIKLWGVRLAMYHETNPAKAD